MLEHYISTNHQNKSILLMTHIVLGYPSLEANHQMIQAMASAGVELIELQIPFSEPIADGPIIIKANQKALEQKKSVLEYLEFAQKMIIAYPQINFLFMTYYNILYQYEPFAFVKKTQEMGIKGIIIPDLPPEENSDLLQYSRQKKIDLIFIFTPTQSEKRLKIIGMVSNGFVYCVARRGVTGGKTTFNQQIIKQINQYRRSTSLPLALGFGLQNKDDINFIKNEINIAVIGSKLIQIQEQDGILAVENFLKNLRQ